MSVLAPFPPAPQTFTKTLSDRRVQPGCRVQLLCARAQGQKVSGKHQFEVNSIRPAENPLRQISFVLFVLGYR